jgi:hypothetical protein
MGNLSGEKGRYLISWPRQNLDITLKRSIFDGSLLKNGNMDDE